MLNLKNLPKDVLVANLLNCIAEERLKTNEILDYLREIDRRMIYAEFGYSSLFDFCLKHLGYSEGSTQRRIAAMRLIRELPEVKEKIASGDITLSNVAKLGAFIRHQQKKSGQRLPPSQKRELLSLIENKTQKEVDMTFAGISPSIVETKEIIKPLSQEHMEIKIILNSAQLETLERTKMAISNAKPTATYGELLTYVCEYYLKKNTFAKYEAKDLRVLPE